MTPAVFAHGHLRLYLLSLLGERAMHGYELIQALEEKFGGTYVPSAGTIYPRLAKLEEEGLVTKAPEGRKTVYALTDAGRAELEARTAELSGIENDVTDSVRRLADEVRSSVNEAMRSLRADLAAATREARDEAKAAGRTIRAESVRTSSNNHVHEVEAILTKFRHDVRSELRARATRGELTAETVAALKTQLDAVRSSI
jgi:DNA-binding PadR family transcriptional regulator